MSDAIIHFGLISVYRPLTTPKPRSNVPLACGRESVVCRPYKGVLHRPRVTNILSWVTCKTCLKSKAYGLMVAQQASLRLRGK